MYAYPIEELTWAVIRERREEAQRTHKAPESEAPRSEPVQEARLTPPGPACCHHAPAH